jgi:hypothetical protein
MADLPTFRFVLVPGFWLGSWASDTVADVLRGAGHDVTAVTLPGLGSASEDRSAVSTLARAPRAEVGVVRGRRQLRALPGRQEPDQRARDYFDITSTDTTTGAPAGNGAYLTTPGWDYLTGWGAPRVTGLICDINGKGC